MRFVFDTDRRDGCNGIWSGRARCQPCRATSRNSEGGGGGGEEGTLRKWVVSLEQSAYTLFLPGINSFKAGLSPKHRVVPCPCAGGREKPLGSSLSVPALDTLPFRIFFFFFNKNKFGGRKCESFGVTQDSVYENQTVGFILAASVELRTTINRC